MIIGLTGGIASGKTLCSNWFGTRSIVIVDADVIARRILATDQVVLQQIMATFGSDVLDEDGSVNRARLRERVFASHEDIKRLNTIIHPAIRQRLLYELYHAPLEPYGILSAPLLLENNLDVFCDAIVLIDVSLHTQLLRAIHRGQQQRQTIEAMIAAQISRKERLRRANFIVDNEGDVVETYKQLDMLHHRFLSWC